MSLGFQCLALLRRRRPCTRGGHAAPKRAQWNLPGAPAPIRRRLLIADELLHHRSDCLGLRRHPGSGDTVSTRRGPLAVRVEVRAPAWIDVDRVSILVDGVGVLERPTNGSAPLRFAETLSIPLARDGFVIVRVDGDRPMAPVIGDGDRFQVFPVAITKPIWVDFDDDGTVTPSVVD